MIPNPHAPLALLARSSGAQTGGSCPSPAGLAGRGSVEVLGVAVQLELAPAKVFPPGPVTAACDPLGGHRGSFRNRMERHFELPDGAAVFARAICRNPDPGARTMELSAVTKTLEVRNGYGTPPWETGQNEENC